MKNSMIVDTRPLMVTIRCTAYNHELYIRQCLEGFVMQHTNFKFEAIVHDDASTDGTADIIREFEKKYPDIIKPIYETENQHSKHDGSLVRILDENTHGKYVAICEGDDYWTDPLKLQKQFDFMESHPDCSMCFHAHKELYPSGVKKECAPPINKDLYSVEDVVLGGGGFMATNSMFYRWQYLKNEGRPDFWKKCPVGDLPLMLFLAFKGTIGYIDNSMSVHRAAALGSWTSRQNTISKKRSHHYAILKMFDDFDDYTGFKFHNVIKKKKRINIKNYYKEIVASFYRKLKSIIRNEDSYSR